MGTNDGIEAWTDLNEQPGTEHDDIEERMAALALPMSDAELMAEIERRDPEGTKSDLDDPSTEEAELYRIAGNRGLLERR